jgi:hypothetical protein
MLSKLIDFSNKNLQPIDKMFSLVYIYTRRHGKQALKAQNGAIEYHLLDIFSKGVCFGNVASEAKVEIKILEF